MEDAYKIISKLQSKIKYIIIRQIKKTLDYETSDNIYADSQDYAYMVYSGDELDNIVNAITEKIIRDYNDTIDEHTLRDNLAKELIELII